MYLSFILYIIYNLSSQVLGNNLSSQDLKDLPIFQPVPTLKIDTTKLCKGGQSYQVFPFSQSSKNYVALSMTTCGLYIYDITDLKQAIIVFQDILVQKGETQAITYSNVTQHLWIAHSSGKFFGIDATQQPFIITISGNSIGNLPIYKIVPWPQDNNILFLMCYTQFQIVDFRQPSQGLVQLQQVSVNGLTTYQIKFIQQNQFALITTSNIGVQFFKVKNGNDIDNISFTYSCFLKPTYFDVNNFQVVDENTIAVMMLYRGIFLYDIKEFLDNNGDVCNQTVFKRISTSPNYGQGGQMSLSQNQKFIYGQFRSVGVKVFDLSQRKFQIVQNLFVDSSCNDIRLNSSENLLYYTNSVTLQIFERTVPNFNRDVPNLMLNTFQITQFNFFKEDPNLGNLDYYCVLNESKQQLYLARADYGAAAFKYSGQGILESQSFVYRQQNSLFPTSRITFLADNSTAYLTRIRMGISIVDFSDPSSPVILKENVTMSSPFVAYVFVEFFKEFKFGLVSNYINGYIFSVDDPLNPKIISVIDTYKYTQGQTTFTRFTFSKDQNYVFMILDSYGVLTANITNPYKPEIISSYFTHGCAEFIQTQDQKYGALAATFEGIIIVKIQEDLSFLQVSQIKIVGTIFNIKLMSNDQYIIATTYEYPSIILISIVDILNPTIVQIIGDTGAIGYYSICLSNDNSQLFITSQQYLNLLTIQNQIILHTQIYELISVSNTKDYVRQVLNKGQPLQVGQQIEMHLIPIYQTQGILVRSASYYYQNVLQPLPSWMTFQPSTKILSLSISKDSLQKNSLGQYIDTIQQVVFLTYQQVIETAFINSYLQINSDDSSLIKKACMIAGYIDESGYIQPSYTPSQKLSFGINENVYLQKWVGPKLDVVKDFIQYILNQNIINYTTSFEITQSIIVNLQNKSQIIFSIENNISVQLQMLEVVPGGSTIPTNKAKFVLKNYPSVLILISSAQDQIKLEGSLDNINSILSTGIKYSLGEIDKDQNKDILVQMTVSDGVNYDYVNIFPYKDLVFLSEQAPVSLSPEMNLQKDFNSKYSHGEIYIQENFQYQISSYVFTCVDSPILQYSAQILQDGQFVNIPKQSWIQFSPTDRVFTGNPSNKFYNEKIVIQISATDGYTHSVDKLIIIPNKIPFAYIFQFAIQILGPLFGLLGLYKYKHLFYNLFLKKQYIYSKDVAYVGEVYKKQITITNNTRKQVIKLWEFFKSKIGENEILYQLQNELIKGHSATSYEYFLENQASQHQETDQGLNFEDEVMLKMYPYGINKQEMRIVDNKSKKVITESSQRLNDALRAANLYKNENSGQEDKQKLQTSQLFNMDNQTLSALTSHRNTHRNNQLQFARQQTFDTKSKINSKTIAENIKQNIQTYNKVSRSQYLHKNEEHKDEVSETLEIFKDGQINYSQILSYVKEKQEELPEKKRILNEIQLESLSNPYSLLSQAFCCILVDYLMQKDKITKTIFYYMQKKACKYYLDIDWYKAYINTSYSFEDVHTNPYPQFLINQKTFKASLKEVFQSISKYFYDPQTKSPKEIKFSLTLLQEAIKTRAIGFTMKSPQIFQATQGESIHAYSYLIQAIKTYERNDDISCCLNVHKCLDIQYIEKGLTDNEKLPSWIHTIDLINGSILISGIPEKKDIGSILIKIIDNNKFIVRSFQIQILQKQANSDPNIQAFHLLNESDTQKDIQLKKIRNNSDLSQYNMQALAQKIRLKKASAFARSISQNMDLQQSQSNYKHGNNIIQGELSPSFCKTKLSEFHDQITQFDEEKEFELFKTPKDNIEERKKYKTNPAKQNNNFNQQANTFNFIDCLTQNTYIE